jgi:hypothetical protein
MRRSLVLTNEKAGHAFRASLPSHVFEVEPEGRPSFEPEVEQKMAELRAGQDKASLWKLTRRDVRGFVSTYLATFLAALVFIM